MLGAALVDHDRRSVTAAAGKESKLERFERLEAERLENRPEPVHVAGLHLLVRSAAAREWPHPSEYCHQFTCDLAARLADRYTPTSAGLLVSPYSRSLNRQETR